MSRQVTCYRVSVYVGQPWRLTHCYRMLRLKGLYIDSVVWYFVILCSLSKCSESLFSIMINGFTFILEVIFGKCPYRCKQIKGKRLLKSFLRRYNNLMFLSWENRWSYLSMVLESNDSKAFLIHRTHLSHSLLFNKTWNSYKCTILNFYKRRNVEMHQ